MNESVDTANSQGSTSIANEREETVEKTQHQ